MRDLLPALTERGARVALVGNGSPEQAKAFAAEHAAGLAVYTDPERRTYAAAGFTASLLASLSLGVIGRARAAQKEGFRQNSIEGSALQQGGVLIAGPGDVLHGRYSSRGGGDHPTDAWILEHLPDSRI